MTSSRDNKHHKKDSSSESSDSSSSSSHSELECFSNDKEHKHKHNKKHHKHCKSSEKSDSESSSHSKSEHKPKFRLCDIYSYFKNRLIEDEQLMIAGSTSYAHSTSTQPELIPANHAIKLNNDFIMYNIDRFSDHSPFFVRESGVYIFFLCLTTDNSAQFTFFVNGLAVQTTCIGTNSGAGQIVSRHMITLNKDDNVIIRNYTSTSPSVIINTNIGGLQVGNSVVVVVFKIAPINPATIQCENEVKFMESLTHKKKKLFKKLTEKVLCDKTLMPEGFNVHGSFFNTLTQTVTTENVVQFNNTSVYKGLYWDPLNPSQVKVLEDGVYKLFFLTNTNTAGQFSFAVNGVPVNSSTQGSNRGAGQITIRSLCELKQNDIVTVVNHTSANGSIVISENAGGKYLSVNASFIIFKLCPLEKAQQVLVDCKLSKHYECYYLLFRDYLLYHKFLQINGSNSYLSASTSITQVLNIGDSVHWINKLEKHNIDFTQGDKFITIEKDGIYDIFADVITDEPLQITIFINNVPDYNSTFGRDSGAARTLIRQIRPLHKGDMVSIRNWEAHAGIVNTAENPGGSNPGQNTMFMVFLLSPLIEPPMPCPPQPCPPQPCPPQPCHPHPCPPINGANKKKSK